MRAFAFLWLAMMPAALFAQSFQNIESVEFDPIHNLWLVSNGNSIIYQNYQGDLDYFFSCEANYGMEVMGDTLYAINTVGFSGYEVHCYDMNTGYLLNDFSINASFANGMASDGQSRLWITDFSGQRIYEVDVTDLNDPTVTQVASLNVTPNGITYDPINDRLVFVTWGGSAGIYEMTLPDYNVNQVASTNLGNIDGIDNDDEGNFFTASWTPAQIRKYTNDFSSFETISAPGLSSPADICYVNIIDTLAIPNSGNNTLTLIGFGTSDIPELQSDNTFNLFPNPLQDSSVLDFYLAVSTEVNILFRDSQGRITWEWGTQNLAAGRQRVLMTGIELPSGIYNCEFVRNGEVTASKRVVVER